MIRVRALLATFVLALAALVPAYADSQIRVVPLVSAQLEVTQLHGFNAGAALAPATVDYRATAVSNSGLTTYQFTGLDAGTAAPDRDIVVAVGCRTTTARTINTVALNVSTTMTPVVEIEGSGGSAVGLYIVSFPTGTTGHTIDVTLSGSANRCGVGAWAVYGLASLTATDTDTAVTTTNPSVTSSVQAGGVIIGFNYASTSSVTWTGIAEDFDSPLTGPNSASGASGAFATLQNVSVGLTSSSADQRLVVASFR